METLGLVAGVGSVITIVSRSITSLNTARIKFSEADLSVELLVGQLHTVRTALNQVQAFVKESPSFDDCHEEFVTDLCVAVEHCKLLVQHIDDQIARLEWLPGDSLHTRSKARLLLEERVLRDNMMLLNNQVSALNLCLTAFKCRPNSPSSEPFERELARYREQQLANDTASAKVAADFMSFPPPSNPQPTARPTSRVGFIKKFDLDRLSLKANFYEHGFRTLSRSSSLGTHESQEQSPITLKSSMLKLSNSIAQSARIESLIKRDANQRQRQLKLLALGQRSASTIKRLRFAIASSPQPEEVERCRRTVVPSAVKSLLSLAEYVGNTVALFHIIKRQSDIQVLESFVEQGGPTWEVSPYIHNAAMSLWTSPRVQECFKQTNQECSSAYFLRATERILRPDYEPTVTDVIKADDDQKAAATQAKMTIDDLLVDIIDAPQPKLQRLTSHFDDTDGFLLSLDLSTYDQYADGLKINALDQTLRSIKRQCNTSSSAYKPVILIMYNAAAFRRKIAASPLTRHFPEYRAAKDFNSAKEFILQCCRKVLHPEQALFHHYSEDDSEDPTTVDFFKDTIQELPPLIACSKNLDQYLGISPTNVRGPVRHAARKHSSPV